jgi:hypothetical protein
MSINKFRYLIFAGAVSVTMYGQSPAPQPAAFSAVDEMNRSLPDWLKFGGDFRGRAEGYSGGLFKNNSTDAYYLNRFRVNMKVRPTPWLNFQFQGQDAWSPFKSPGAPPYQDRMDLRLAFMEIGSAEKGSVALRVGRQELNFGEQRLVGSANWLNVARSFDAVRLTLRHEGFRLDAFSSSVVKAQAGAFDRFQPGDNLHGLYGGIEKLVPRAVIEPFVFWRVGPRMKAESGRLGVLDFKTIGFRWVGKLPANFDYGTEVAFETGSLGSDSVRSRAAHAVVGYTFAVSAWKPRLFAEYNYASGDRNSNDNVRGTFDQLYPTNHDKYGLADQFGWKNIRHLRAGLEIKPLKKLTLAAGFHDFWLDSATDGLYSAAGALVVRKADGTAGTHVGEELDAQAMYSVNKQMQFGAGYGYLFAGEFLKNATKDGHSYSMPYVFLGYTF